GMMKNGSLILNIVLLIAVGVLFYLHFNSPKSTIKAAADKPEPKEQIVSSAPPGGCNIAYFEMDSVEANFDAAKKWKKELEKKEDYINSRMNQLNNEYQEKFLNFQQHKSSMNNAQMDAATNDLGQLKEKIENTRSDLDQDYKTYYVQTQQEILSMIRKFCTDYNKDRKYSIIISNEPGIIFYKDTTLDITKDLLKGLNDMYVKEKAQSK
ncbi:MAG TPA: OmpH family outer membrane protein, partial [Chitinophagaceae bacterium]